MSFIEKNYSEKDKILALGNIKLNDITQNHLWKILQKQVGDVDGVYEYLDTLAKLTPQKQNSIAPYFLNPVLIRKSK